MEKIYKSVFLCADEKIVRRVYKQETIDLLEKKAGLYTGKMFTRQDVLTGAVDLTKTEYIFSTWGMPGFTEEEIGKYFPSLKCVFYAAGSVQGFARSFIRRGVKVFSAWAANGVPVAEYAVAQIVLANKGFYATSRAVKAQGYKQAQALISNYPGNFNAKVGVIGAGMIGKMVIKRLRDYRISTLVFDPFLPEEKAKELGTTKASLEEIFSTCNVITNHLADNKETRGMLTGRLFEKMMPYSTFINTGRGAQLSEKDLTDMLSKRQDVTALLDVTYPEPPVEGSPLYTLPNVILTPHIAGSLGFETYRMAEYMEEEFERLTAGEKTLYEVTEKMLETMA